MSGLFDAAWFDDLRRRLRAIGPLGAGGPRLSLGQIVHGTPDGTVSWTLHVGAGEDASVQDGVSDAQVTLVEDFQTATLLQAGTPTSDLLYSGKVKVTGDVDALLRGADVLTQLNAALNDIA